MIQLFKFLFNGALLGILAAFLHQFLRKTFDVTDSSGYLYISIITYVPLIIFNFNMQKVYIFSAPGVFHKFIASNFFIMILVSALSPVCRWAIARHSNLQVGSDFGFIVAALLCSIPSFLLSKFWVFSRNTPK